MTYFIEEGNIVLTEPVFDLDQTLDCGQAFRWRRLLGGSYAGYAGNHFLHIGARSGAVVFFDTSEEDFLGLWAPYFDLATDYEALKACFCADETMRAACAYAGGLRLLRQDPWEALISFILSQNNNIQRIKGIIERLCELFGGRFPAPGELAALNDQALAPLRAGFRTRYLQDAAKQVTDGAVDLDAVAAAPLDQARAMLMQICGVGEKVADCVLLYGFYRTDAFPKDVWMKRVMERFYPGGLPACALRHAGIAQQYLFHYIRTCTSIEGTR